MASSMKLGARRASSVEQLAALIHVWCTIGQPEASSSSADASIVGRYERTTSRLLESALESPPACGTGKYSQEHVLTFPKLASARPHSPGPAYQRRGGIYRTGGAVLTGGSHERPRTLERDCAVQRPETPASNKRVGSLILPSSFVSARVPPWLLLSRDGRAPKSSHLAFESREAYKVEPSRLSACIPVCNYSCSARVFMLLGALPPAGPAV